MIQITLDAPIARGRTADVYDWDDGHVLKLFHNWFELGDIEYEFRLARAVYASGVKSPNAVEIVQVEGRNGLIYERAAGESMLEMLQRKPWMLFAYARILAGLHVQMHGCTFSAEIPAQRDRLRYKIHHARALSDSLKESLLGALESLPEGKRVCHGDFHPANVLLSGDDATVIDWIDASRGTPLADVARTTLILRGAAETKQTTDIASKVLIKTFHAAYLKEYFRLHPNGRDEYRRWLPIVAGARLSEGMPELESWLVKQSEKILRG
jgi:uncharacterized protein (TIGR02172 family)